MAIGLIGGCQAGLSLGLSFIVGRLLDAGWFRWVIGTGSLMVCLGYGGLGFVVDTKNPGGHPADYGPVFAFQGVLAGIGMSCLYLFSSQLAVSVGPRLSPIANHIVKEEKLGR